MVEEGRIAGHYGHRGLQEAIADALSVAGKSLTEAKRDELAAVDEFHIGGRAATIALAEALAPQPGTRLLDIGCGLGGTARHFAAAHGCLVEGIDLSPDYVATATALSEATGLAERTRFHLGSAMSLPFPPGHFEAATLLHVGMNIPDKAALFAGIRRVLRDGGLLGIYDVMRLAPGELPYPLPWAADCGMDFAQDRATYRQALAEAGFVVTAESDMAGDAIALFEKMRARLVEGGPPPLGLHILMGPGHPAKTANMIAALNDGLVEPVRMVARAGLRVGPAGRG